jgi:6-phosphogluconolactonase
MNRRTTEPEYVVLLDKEALSRAAAGQFVALAAQRAQGGRFTVALSGGSTPRRLFELLASDPFRSQVPWARVEVFWGDERCVPPDHPDSNYRMAREALLDHVDLPPQNVHRVRGEWTPDRSADHYQSELERVLGPDLGFDLILLGMGSDGHTASLFPGSPTLEEGEEAVVAVYAAHLDSWRVTLTLPVLNRAHHVLFLVSGASKAGALARIRAGEPLPAGRVCPSRGTLTWLIDRDAAGLE